MELRRRPKNRASGYKGITANSDDDVVGSCRWSGARRGWIGGESTAEIATDDNVSLDDGAPAQDNVLSAGDEGAARDFVTSVLD